MDSATTKIVWLEPLAAFTARWVEVEDEAGRELPPAKEVLKRALTRTNKLKQQTPMEFPRPLANDRQWESRDADEPVRRIRSALRELGWKVIIAEGPRTRNQALVQGDAIDGNLVLMDIYTTEATLARLVENGCPFPLKLGDALGLRLAEELFHAVSERLGNEPPESWVGELSMAIYCQEALGWPFNPMAAQLIEARQ